MASERPSPPTLDVAAYLRMARGQTIAPMLLEIVLRSGRSYFIKNVFPRFDERNLFALRVWDLRALSEDDTASLVQALNERKDRDAWRDYRDFQPKLDEGNLWVRIADVEHIMEWHDRLWPREAAAESPRPLGFRSPEEDS